MVYTTSVLKLVVDESAIAEIILWFTPTFNFESSNPLSAIAEIILWFTPDSGETNSLLISAIAEILLWFTPIAM